MAVMVISSMFVIPAFAAEDHCPAGKSGLEFYVHCRLRQSTQESRDIEVRADSPTRSAPAYEYLWLPNCPGTKPSGYRSDELDCFRAHTCASFELVSMTLYRRHLGAGGSQSGQPWEYLGTECRNPSDAGPVQPQQQRRTLTWQNVLSAVRRVAVPGGTVHAPRFTLVNLETTFWTDPQPVDRSITVIGFDVDVQITPSSYTWHWGDGTTDTTETPGRPFPATDVTHTYVHATDEGPPLEVSVDVTYSARYRVNGGEWQAIPETITIPGAPTSLPVKQAAAVLMSSD